MLDCCMANITFGSLSMSRDLKHVRMLDEESVVHLDHHPCRNVSVTKEQLVR